MSIKFHCTCGQPLVVKDEQGGIRVRCPRCQEVITVPASPVQQMPVAAPVQATPPPPPPRRQPVDDQTAPWLEQPPPRSALRESEPQAGDENPFDMKRLSDPYDEGRPRRKRSSEWGAGNNTTLAGLGMMIVAVLWFVVGLAAGYIFFYPPVLFIVGFVSLIRGITGHH